GALVHEEYDHGYFRMIGEHGLGDLLEEDGLARARRRHDQPALPLADGRDQVHGAHGELIGGCLQAKALVRLHRGEALEAGGGGGRWRQASRAAAVGMWLARPSRSALLRRTTAHAAPMSGSSTQRRCP